MLAVTMGDGNGVGPEIILKAVRDGELKGQFAVVGDYSVLDYCNKKLGYAVPMHRITELAQWKTGILNVFDLGLLTGDQVTPGEISKAVSAASEEYVARAARLILDGQFSAMVTLPVNKEAIRLTDPNFSGHTELIAEICGQEDFTMMLASDKLTVTHVSTHVSMRQAIENVTKERVLRVIELTNDALKRFLPSPRIAVAGLNPHAGEGGAFGREEIDEINPAVEAARAKGIDAVGSIPPDTVYLKASRGEFDAVVGMYHDQGHIPMKVLDFEGGVNVTLGLKVIRTSVDHGTAFDIAYQGKADTRSFVCAYNYALKLQQA